MGRAANTSTAAAVARRYAGVNSQAFLAPASTGWLENSQGDRSSVNVRLDEQGNYYAWAVAVYAGHPRVRKPLYVGRDVEAAAAASNEALTFLLTRRFKARQEKSSERHFTAAGLVATCGGAPTAASPAAQTSSANAPVSAGEPDSAAPAPSGASPQDRREHARRYRSRLDEREPVVSVRA